MRSCLRAAALAALAALAAGSVRSEEPLDVYYLKNGDRISGRTVLKGRKNFGLQTRYGRLNIPRDGVASIRWSDGKEELLQSASVFAKVGPPVGLVLTITGRSFWQAWDPRDAPADPSLRLELTLDEVSLASYVDPRTDARDLPGATVNTFQFVPADVVVRARAGVLADPPEAQPGRITLRLHLPAALAGERRLRVVYQHNQGTAAEPAWRDLAETGLAVTLKSDATALVGLAQDAGRMDYSKKRMKFVETFKLEARPAAEAPAAELDTSRPEP